jgi:hypothetical protein
MICTLGGRIVANQMAREVSLELAGHVFSTHHVVLDGHVIDVILEMSWMKWHEAILDIAKWLVYLDSLIYGKVVLHLLVIVHIKASMHHTVAKSIEEIPVVPRIFGCFSQRSARNASWERYWVQDGVAAWYCSCC